MINIACLYPRYFQAIVDGRKQTEWRDRIRPDSRMEAIRAGELIILLECRSTRAIMAIVRHVKRFRRHGGYRYGVRFSCPVLTDAPNMKHLQGWHRRATL